MEKWLLEMRQAARVLQRKPAFAVVTILTLALGIGAATAVFSVVNGVLLRPLPFPGSGAIMQLWQVGRDGNTSRWSAPNFLDVKQQSGEFSALAAYAPVPMSVLGPRSAARLDGAYVSHDFLSVLGVEPLLGRGFSSAEVDGEEPVVLIGHDYWRHEFNGNPSVIGSTLMVDDESRTVIGVLPPHAAFPMTADFWLPMRVSADASRTAHNWYAIGRLADGVTRAQAGRELDLLATRLHELYGKDTFMTGVALKPLREEIAGEMRPMLLVLLGSAVCLLLIACANVANLVLARATSRRNELAIRAALGAGRLRLLRQYLSESLLLSLSGGVCGVALAWACVKGFLAIAPAWLPRGDDIGVDSIVLVFALGVSLLSTLTIGLVAAWHATSVDGRESLAGYRSAKSSGIGAQRTRASLIASQVALTFVLLVGAGLLGRSLMQLLAVDPGYFTSDVVVMNVSLPYPKTPADRTRAPAFHHDLLVRLRALPGIESVGGTQVFPMTGGYFGGEFIKLNRPDEIQNWDDWRRFANDEARKGQAEYRVASPGYLEAMGIPVLQGRSFDERDNPETPHAAIISRTLARTYWPDRDPLGQMVQFGNMDGDLRHPFTIVGIVDDIRERDPAAKPEAIFYVCDCQRINSLGGDFHVALRGSIASSALISAARQAVHELDPGVPVSFRTIEQIVSSTLADRRVSLYVLAVFAVVALLLAAAGLYGVIAYLVAQQTREIGVRMALGANAANIIFLVVSRGAMLAVLGLAFGAIVATVATRALAGMLYGVGTLDPVVFAGITLLLGTVVLVACSVPAFRAARMHPMHALRDE